VGVPSQSLKRHPASSTIGFSATSPDVDAVLGHHLARALRYQHETVETAEAALPLRPAHQVQKCVLPIRLTNHDRLE